MKQRLLVENPFADPVVEVEPASPIAYTLSVEEISRYEDNRDRDKGFVSRDESGALLKIRNKRGDQRIDQV